MNITKTISIFVIITLIYLGSAYFVSQPPDSMSYPIRISAYWINFVIDFPSKIVEYIMSASFYDKHYDVIKFTSPLIWTLLIAPWLGNKNEKSLLSSLDSGFINTEKNISILPATIKQKFANALSLNVLTDVEDLILYRISVLLPIKYRQILKKQLGKMNRVQRIFGDKHKVIMLTTFDSRNLYLFGKKEIYPKIDIKDYEAVLASCIVVAKNGHIAVDLIICKGVLARIQFQSDTAIDTLRGPFFVQDVRVNKNMENE